MKTYVIVMIQRNIYRVEVTADNEDEAYELALEKRVDDNIVDSTLDWSDVEACYDAEEEEGEEE